MPPKRRTKIADQIASELNEGDLHDSEDELAPRLVSSDDEVYAEGPTKQFGRLNLRSRVRPLDDDPRYAGEVVERRKIDSQGTATAPAWANEPGSSPDTSDSIHERSQLASDMEELHDSQTFSNGTDGDSDGGSDGDDAEFDEDEDESGPTSALLPFGPTAVQDAKSNAKKGQATRAQYRLLEVLLSYRMKYQKLLGLINQLPQGEAFSNFLAHSEPDVHKSVGKASKNLLHCLTALQQAQDALALRNKALGSAQKDKDASDEEIPSSDDEDASTVHGESTAKGKQLKQSVKSVEEGLKRNYDRIAEYQNSTLRKWHERTRLAGGKLQGDDVVSQLEAALADETRLLRRTQQKRSNYLVIGQKSEASGEPERPVATDEDIANLPFSSGRTEPQTVFDAEIFDDDDFYQQLLREFIERKSRSGDTTMISEWNEVQQMRSRLKKKVDTKASKGRKVRYDIHPKIVNFMAPIDFSVLEDEPRSKLFKSLFDETR